MEAYKQVILVRKDLRMPAGKLSVQCSHATLESVFKSNKLKVKKWYNQGMKKVILKVKDEKELLKYKKKADFLKLKTALIRDAAKTFFKKPTITCLAIGPDLEKKIDKVTGKLKMI